jgi:hypothetical protein
VSPRDTVSHQQARKERFTQLHQAYLERQRLYRTAQSAPEQQDKKAATATGRKAGRAVDVPWMDCLSPSERPRVEAIRPEYNEFMRLGLNKEASREAWLAEDPDDEKGRRVTYELLRAAYTEHHRLYNKANRQGAKRKMNSTPETPPEIEGKQVLGSSGRYGGVERDGRRGSPGNLGATAAGEASHSLGMLARVKQKLISYH